MSIADHVVALALATLGVLGYTALVWWVCQPGVKAFARVRRRTHR